MSWRRKIIAQSFDQTVARFNQTDCRQYIEEMNNSLYAAEKLTPGYHMIPIWKLALQKVQARLTELENQPTNGESKPVETVENALLYDRSADTAA